MTDSCDGMVYNHTRTGISHDCPDFFFHVRAVAMYGAFAATCFVVAKRAFG